MSKEMKKEINYELEQKVPYATKAGLPAEGTFVTLTAPTSRNMNECAYLKQAFFRSLPKSDPDASAEAGDGEVTGAAVMAIITMSKDVDLAGVLISARELFASGVAMMEGEVKMTKPLLDAMSQDDLEAMTGEYMANFILASALRKMRKS